MVHIARIEVPFANTRSGGHLEYNAFVKLVVARGDVPQGDGDELDWRQSIDASCPPGSTGVHMSTRTI